MDDIERAQEKEQKYRAQALAAVRSLPFRDYAKEICTGCDYATKSNHGQSCEAWRDCLQDLQRRERNA